MKPLALVCSSNVLIGGQLAGRLQDLGYRVQTVHDAATLTEVCEREKPIVLLAEASPPAENFATLARVKQSSATSHIPILAFTAAPDKTLQTAAEQAGVSILTSNTAVHEHLPQLLARVLEI